MGIVEPYDKHILSTQVRQRRPDSYGLCREQFFHPAVGEGATVGQEDVHRIWQIRFAGNQCGTHSRAVVPDTFFSTIFLRTGATPCSDDLLAGQRKDMQPDKIIRLLPDVLNTKSTKAVDKAIGS